MFVSSFAGGKRDEDLILPMNDSLSVTLNLEQVSSISLRLEIIITLNRLTVPKLCFSFKHDIMRIKIINFI